MKKTLLAAFTALHVPFILETLDSLFNLSALNIM